MSGGQQVSNRRPLSVINSSLSKPAYVKLKNDLAYKGILSRADSQMNLILEEAVEYVDEESSASLGTVLIRGNNILYIRVGYDSA